jgi:hypothetical protein
MPWRPVCGHVSNPSRLYVQAMRQSVGRIEFQVRRDRLRVAGIRTLEQLRTLQGDLLRELAENHTTLRLKTGDTNHSRWPLHPLWKALQRNIAALPQTGLVKSIDPENGLLWRRQKQLQSLYGSLKGLAAVDGLIRGRNEPISFDTLLSALPDLLNHNHSESLWLADVEQRMTAYRYGKW